ncbi:MAG: pyridoxamine 5'-phosphate oxidase family protein [Caulobacteraceae bacterium]
MSLQLGEEIRGLVDGALMGGHPMILAVVDPQGRPRLSFRGSLHSLDDARLCFWARDRDGRTIRAIAANPNVAVMLRIPSGPTILQFSGAARLAADAKESSAIFEGAPEVEQRADPDRKGVGVVIDLERVEGLLGLDAEGGRRFVRLLAD